MKRPLVIATIGYTIGIIGGLYFSFCIVLFAVLFLLFLYMIAYFGKDMKIKKLKKSVILCLIFIILGSGIVSYQEKSYEESYNEEEIEVLGIVISSKKEKEYKDVYKIKVLRVGEDKSFYNKNIQLNVKKKKGQNQELEYGDLISFSGIYEKPSKSRNEYGFDYSMYLKSVKIYGDVTLEGDLKVIKKRQVPFFSLASYLFKEKVKSKIGILTKGKIKELFTGILIGDTQLLEKETKDYFKDSSLSHLLAVSGAHISYLVLGVTEFLNKMKIGKNYTKISICIILLFFMSVVGFTPSVTRAGIMGILVLLSGLFHRKNDVITSLCASLFFILLANPFSITNIGLQLSFGGTIGILAFQKKILSLFNRKEKIIEGFLKKGIDKIKEALAVTFSAQIIIFPILLFNFGTVSFTFFISNLLAGPLLGIIMILGFIVIIVSFFLFPIAKILMIPLSLSLNLLLLVAKYSSYLPFSKIYVPIPNLIFFAFYYIFFICIGWDKLKEFRKKIANKIRIQKVKLFSLFLILIVILGIIHISPNDLKVYFIDVGQGDCSLVISPYGKKILIDGGGSKEVSNFDVGENTILPFLLHKGVTNIDIVMISHFDADHCNGLISILESINVKKVVISKQASISEEYLKFVNIIKERKIPVQIVKRGDKINIDKQSYFEILHPAEELMDDQKGGLNINSIVAKLVYKTSKEKFRTLFTGDIEEKGEQELLNKEIELQSEVLKVGHHGSKSSTTENFLDKVNPKIALIGVGEKNTFGHPSSVVIERLTRRKIRIYRTDINGEIKMSINKKRKDSYR